VRGKYPILLTYLIDHLGLAIVFPIFTPLVLGGHFKLFSSAISHQEKGYIFALLIVAFPIAQFFGAPLIGSLSDKIGRKKAFIATILGTAIGYSIIGLGTLWNELSVLFLGRFWTGFFSGNLTLCLASLSDLSQDERVKAQNFSLLATAGGLSFIIASLIAQILFDAHPSYPFWLTSALSFINLILMLIFFKETRSKLEGDKPHIFQGFHNILSVFKLKKLRNIFLIYFFFTLCWIPTLQFLPMDISNTFVVSSTFVKNIFIALGLLWSFTNFFLNPYLHRNYPNHKILLCSLPLLSLALFSIHLFPFLSLFFIAFTFAIIGGALSWTNILLALSNTASPEIQGRILGMNQSVGAIAIVTGLSISGLLAIYNLHAVFLFTASAPLIGWVLLKRLKFS